MAVPQWLTRSNGGKVDDEEVDFVDEEQEPLGGEGQAAKCGAEKSASAR